MKSTTFGLMTAITMTIIAGLITWLFIELYITKEPIVEVVFIPLILAWIGVCLTWYKVYEILERNTKL